MNILYLLIPLGLVLLGIAVWAFMWAVRSGQFDDLEGPAHRILMDDDERPHGNIAPDEHEHDGPEAGVKAGSEANPANAVAKTDNTLQDKGK